MICNPAHIYICAFQMALSVLVLPAFYSQTFLTVWAGQVLTPNAPCTPALGGNQRSPPWDWCHSCQPRSNMSPRQPGLSPGIGSQGLLPQAPSVSSSLWRVGAGGTVKNVTLQWFWMPPSVLVTVNLIPREHILQGHPQPLSTAEPPANLAGSDPQGLSDRNPKT